MENNSNDFIGRGWKFPVEFRLQATGGEVMMLTGDEDIRNSLDVLFSTRVGERIMHTSYGTALTDFLFMSINKSTLTYIEAVISDEILFNEPRIMLLEVVVQPSPNEHGRLDIHLQYLVSATNNRYNYVYPFYLDEATNLKR
jgi:phage baseplate assembly protein W